MPAPEAASPSDYQEHIRLMCDLMVLAFQTDLTRVVTLPFANDGSNRHVQDDRRDRRAPRPVAPRQRNAEKQAKLKKINTFHIEQLAYLLDKLKGVKEADGTTLLDNCMIVYGCGIGDGDRHNHDDLPILLAGKGGGTIEAGRHIEVPARHAAHEPVPGPVRPDGRPDRAASATAPGVLKI